MSRYGRMICGGCGGEHPTNRANLKARNSNGGVFLCKRCKGRRHKSRPKDWFKEGKT